MIEASPGEGGPSPARFGGRSTKWNDCCSSTMCLVPVGGVEPWWVEWLSAANATPAVAHAATASGTTRKVGRNIGISCGEVNGTVEKLGARAPDVVARPCGSGGL